MTTFLISFAFFLTMILCLCIGVLFGRNPLLGSCGGNKCGAHIKCMAGCKHSPHSHTEEVNRDA